MPYGIPWGDIENVYSCISCEFEQPAQHPYCVNCGAKQPSQKRRQALGIEHQIASKREPDEIQAALDEFNGFAVRFWTYSVSHRELQLHFYKTGEHRMILMCAATQEVHLPGAAWAADLELTFENGGDGTTYTISDRKLKHSLRCGFIAAYFGFDSPFRGDGICPW